ncbi:hypothetical protein M434DRAFT_237162 [Hypoxylon sp. CO27-5]|nr:hypothetical protein M434DRAFT_237162 [Hypoxylon sp. CO27-5]
MGSATFLTSPVSASVSQLAPSVLLSRSTPGANCCCVSLDSSPCLIAPVSTPVSFSLLCFKDFRSANLKGMPCSSCSAAISSNVLPSDAASFLNLRVRKSQIM